MPITEICFSGEDSLSESLAWRCVAYALPDAEFIPMRPQQGGKDAVEQNFRGYVGTASSLPFFVMLDLDNAVCPPSAVASLLRKSTLPTLPKNLVLSIVKHEAESWLLGDGARLANFLGIDHKLISDQPETLRNPKEALVKIARKSRQYKRDLCPANNSSASVGTGYNFVLSKFVQNFWRPEVAAINCPTLNRALQRLRALEE